LSRPLTVLSLLDAPVVTGPARGLLNLARALPPSVRLHVALLRGRGAPPPPDLAEMSGGAMVTHELPELAAFDPLIFARAAVIARRIGAGVIQSHSYKPHVIALALRNALRVPWVGHHHGWTAENDKVKRYHRIDALTLPRADRVVAVARSAKEIVVREGVADGDVVVIPNAVERKDIDTPLDREGARAALGLPRDRFVGAVVGRLSHEKGQDVALEALAQARAQGAEVCLAFAGDGPDRAALEARCDALGLREHVWFLGHQRAVGPVYRAADMLVMPSRSEAMPNALLEAMTLGVPAVATRVGGVAEVAEDGESAWIVPPEDPAALASAMRACAGDPTERDRRVARARELARVNHDPRARARRYVALYESLLARVLRPWAAEERV
jgi:glycosyltransferase involved in cell wall biosynthesis